MEVVNPAAVCNALISPAEQFTDAAIGVGSIKTIDKNKIEVKIDDTKLICEGIKECDIREYFSWEEIDKCYLDFVKFNNMDMICFATSNDNPSIYIVCDSIKYNKK